MRLPHRLLTLVPVVAITVATLAVPGVAGPDKIKFPANWKDHVLYSVVDRHDTKQYRELYASTQAAVDAMKAGKELPNGTVLTLVAVQGAGRRRGVAPEETRRAASSRVTSSRSPSWKSRRGWGASIPPSGATVSGSTRSSIPPVC